MTQQAPNAVRLAEQVHDLLMDASERLENVLVKLEAGERWELDLETYQRLREIFEDAEEYVNAITTTIGKARAVLAEQESRVAQTSGPL